MPVDAKRQEAFERFSRAVDGPLMVLAILMIPLLIVPLVLELSPSAEGVVLALDYLIWAVFAIDYFVKLYLAPDRARYFRRNIPDLIIVIVPFLRPLRVLRSVRLLRLLRLVRLGAFLVEALSGIRSTLGRRGVNYVLLIVLAVVVGGAALILEFERGIEGSNIGSFPDALWWAAATITTVGYGDRFPVSPAGRGVAVALMVTGIALFGVITASIAAHFVESEERDRSTDANAKLDEIMGRLESIERRLGADERPGS